MIFLMTGVPGAGKTLSTIKFVLEDKQFVDRPVYYHNIKDCRLDWKELTTDEAMEWFDLPKGSVIVFDECQDIFPVNTTRKGEPPKVLSELAKHRHYGIDIILITQEPRNIDSFVRRLVGLHRHHARHFGTESLKIYEWQNRCCENVHDWHEKQEAVVHQGKLDKKYFGSYYSAEIHTQQKRLPLAKLGIIALPAMAFVACVWFAASFWMDKTSNTKKNLTVAESSTKKSGGFLANLTNKPSTPAKSDVSYMSRLQPRVAGIAFTAPIYDEIREVKSYPIPLCVYSVARNNCFCNSQQGTRLNISLDTCKNIVNNGLFDYSKDPLQKKERSQSWQAERSRPAKLSSRYRSKIDKNRTFVFVPQDTNY